jgi:hypothetical protein
VDIIEEPDPSWTPTHEMSQRNKKSGGISFLLLESKRKKVVLSTPFLDRIRLIDHPSSGQWFPMEQSRIQWATVD